MWKKENPYTQLMRILNGSAIMENSIKIPQNIKNRTTNNFTSGYISPKEMKSAPERDIGIPIFVSTYVQQSRYRNNLSVYQWINR